MSTPLALWEGSQESQLKLLTEGPDQTILLRLLEASCLGEFAKLSAARLDLPTWAQTALDVIGEFLPLESARLTIAPPGVPELSVAFGTGADLMAAGVERFPLIVDGQPAGSLDIVPAASLPAGTSLFSSVSQHLSFSLATVAEAERLRRQAASATALSLAATVDEPCQEAHFQLLVSALAALPGATAARLELESLLLGGPFDVRSGITGQSRLVDLETATRGGSRLRLEMAWAQSAGQPDVRNLDDVVAALVTSLERGERSRKLREEVETDPLTGVGNRRRASAALRAAIGLADRVGQEVAVLAFDLDHFKRINDELGHETGDHVLVAFANLLLTTVRVYDAVARTGGEEFIIVCPGTDAYGAKALAERLRAAVPAACADALPGGWHQTASVGVAVYPQTATSIDALLRKADEALYEAKRSGRDRVSLAPVGIHHP